MTIKTVFTQIVLLLLLRFLKTANDKKLTLETFEFLCLKRDETPRRFLKKKKKLASKIYYFSEN